MDGLAACRKIRELAGGQTVAIVHPPRATRLRAVGIALVAMSVLSVSLAMAVV